MSLQESARRSTLQSMTAQRIYELLVNASERQLSTWDALDRVREAGLEPCVRELLHKIAANAANPLADLFETVNLRHTEE